MSILLALAAASLALGAEVKAIRIEQLESRAALIVETSEAVAVAVDVREGPLILLRIPARAPETLAVPQIEGPIERIRLTREGEATLLSLLLAPGAPFETRHEPTRLTVLFGDAAGGMASATAITPDVYARLFPSGPPVAQASEPPSPDDRVRGGINLGRIAVTPALSATWVDADVSFDSPQPTRNRYLQVQPGVTLASPLLAGQLAVSYEPRLRFLSNHEALERTSHVAGARLALPVGSRISTRAGYTFTRALLEANVVDPGREYFYDLAPFSFHDFDATLEFALASRLYLVADGALTRSRFDQAGGFFDYDRRLIGAGLGYDLRPDLRVDVTYSYDRVPPPPERDVAETSGHGVTADFRGALGPLTTGTLQVGYRSQTSPAAAGASASWSGLVAGASLRRELGRSTSVELAANRATRLSGFETNSYYVSSSATLALTLPLPLQVSARGSVQWLHNDYPERASAIGARREDEIVGWTAGLGRELGRRAWLRLDYRREQRASNLPGFEVTTYGFMVQAGLRLGSGAGTGAGTP